MKKKNIKKGNQIRQNENDDDAAIPLQRTTRKTCCAQLM